MLAKPQGFPRKLGGCAGLDPRLRSAVSAGVGDGERGLRRGLRAPAVGVRPKWVLEYSPSNKRIRYFVSITYVRTGLWTAHKFCGGGVYFFKGSKYARYTMGTGMDSGYPKKIKDHWSGLPSDFQKNIDTAIVRPTDGKVFFLKDKECVRYTMGSGADSGYPKSVYTEFVNLYGPANSTNNFSGDKALSFSTWENKWRNAALKKLRHGSISSYVNALKNTNGTKNGFAVFITKYPTRWIGYASHSKARMVMQYQLGNWGPANMDLVLAHETGHIFRAPDEYSSSNCDCDKKHGKYNVPNKNCDSCPGTNDPCLMVGNDLTICPYSRAHMGWNYSIKNMDCALEHPNGKVYAFDKDEYNRYTYGGGGDVGYAKNIKSNWTGWPSSFKKNLDAAFHRTDTGKLYFFRNEDYLRFTPGSGVDSGYPKKIKGNWRNMPSSFRSNIDAVIMNPVNGKVYLFKGNEYIRYTWGSGMDSGYPKKIKDFWPGLLRW